MALNFQTEYNSHYGVINYWQPIEKYRCDSSKILALDLDWTLIKPIKGKIFPVNKDDWEFLYPQQLSKIKEYIDNGYKFVVFTNQAMILKGKSYDMDGFKDRWLQIYTELGKFDIFSVYLLFAVYDDFYRKPCTGMWTFVDEKLNDNYEINKSSSIFVGDMAGRIKDHSFTDLAFTLNVGGNLKFMVPEVFYTNDTSTKNDTTELIKNLQNDEKIFNPVKYFEMLNTKFKDDMHVGSSKKTITQRTKLIRQNKNTIEKIKDIMKSNKDNKDNKDNNGNNVMIMFVGSPASTKTAFYTHELLPLINKYKINRGDIKGGENKWQYMSNDTFEGSNVKFIKTLYNLFNSGHSVIIDNTNGTIKIREKLIKVAKECNVNTIIAIQFNITKQLVMHLNTIRTKLITIAKNKKLHTVGKGTLVGANAVASGDTECECDTECEGDSKDITTRENIVHKDIVPDVAIHTYWKRFEPINIKDEGIDTLLEWEFIPSEIDEMKHFTLFLD
jgi:DNA 3'-phosphatase